MCFNEIWSQHVSFMKTESWAQLPGFYLSILSICYFMINYCYSCKYCIWTIDIQLDVVSYRILAFMKPKVFLNKYLLLLGEPHIVCAYIYHNVHFRLSWILLFIIPGRWGERMIQYGMRVVTVSSCIFYIHPLCQGDISLLSQHWRDQLNSLEKNWGYSPDKFVGDTSIYFGDWWMSWFTCIHAWINVNWLFLKTWWNRYFIYW